MQFVATHMSNKFFVRSKLHVRYFHIFPGHCVEVQRPDATLQLFQLPVPQLAGSFFFFSVLAFLPIGLRAKPCEIHMLINI